MNKKLGMSNFQIGILFFLGILTCGIVGGISFLVFNKTTGHQSFNIAFPNLSNTIIGKWEVVSGANTGTLYEFFPDGTLSTSGLGTIAYRYSYPDQTHIKLEAGNFSVVFEYTLSNNELTLINNSSALALKKYEEFALSTQIVAGTWKKSRPDNSECFKGLGIYTPIEINFGTDGAFSLHSSVYGNLLFDDFSMNGMYTINGSDLHVTASGIQEHNNPSTTHFPGIGISGALTPTPIPTIPPIRLQGEFNCTVTVSNSRLNFKDALNKNTLFLRAEN